MEILPKIDRSCKISPPSRSWEEVEGDSVKLKIRTHLDWACAGSLWPDQTYGNLYMSLCWMSMVGKLGGWLLAMTRGGPSGVSQPTGPLPLITSSFRTRILLILPVRSAATSVWDTTRFVTVSRTVESKFTEYCTDSSGLGWTSLRPLWT